MATVFLTLLLAAFATSAFARNLYAASYESEDVAGARHCHQPARWDRPCPSARQPADSRLRITPDGKQPSTSSTSTSGTVVSIDTATNQVSGAPITAPEES